MRWRCPPVGSVAFYATLKARTATASGARRRASWPSAWWRWHSSPSWPGWRCASRRLRPPSGRRRPRPWRGATPSGHANPGAQRDEQGQEWFGEFRLIELLGRGGMASVYKAERNGELSALKRPLGSFLDDPDFLERFLREAEIGRALNHPNIVRILGRGNVDQVPYFTMELLLGQTLQGCHP